MADLEGIVPRTRILNELRTRVGWATAETVFDALAVREREQRATYRRAMHTLVARGDVLESVTGGWLTYKASEGDA